MASAFTTSLNLAMRQEREQHLGARAYERTPERGGYANGYKPKRLDTASDTLTVQVPKSRSGDEGVLPTVPETRAALHPCRHAGGGADVHPGGVHTRCGKVMAEFGLESLSSSQVSCAAATLDEGLYAWRNRPLGQVRYLFLDARYEKVRAGGVVRDAALLSAISVDGEGRRSVLGIFVALSEAEVHCGRHAGERSSTVSFDVECEGSSSLPVTTIPA